MRDSGLQVIAVSQDAWGLIYFEKGEVMAKVSEDAAAELPLNDERVEPKTHSRHVKIALRHMHADLDKLSSKISEFSRQRDDLIESIQVLG